MRSIRLLVIMFAALAMTEISAQQCRPLNDSAVLVDFYGASKGLSWKVKWDLNKPFRTWPGITVNQSGCVTRLELPDNNLQGNITNLDLPFLEYLDVSGNNMLSTLPALSKLPSLKHLNLSGNRFRGSLPALTASVKLEKYEANNNQFDGGIPDYSALTELRVFNLSNNSLTGQIGVTAHFSKLTHLYLNNNHFQGNIPAIIDKMDLVDIDLSANQFTGGLPELDGLTKLTKVNFSENRLSGSFQWPVSVPELHSINISHNLLSDTIPPTGPVGKLSLFLASNNQFTGSIPEMDLPQLERLLLAQNQLTGTIPDLANLPNLEQFSFRHNELEDIDFEPGFLNQIAFADISENRFTFQDLVPFRNFRGTTISLFPQKKIPFKTPEFTVTKGNNYTIVLDTDEDHGNTDFQWFKDGKRLPVGKTENFSISNVIPRDAGIYTVTLTNSQFVGFPIMSEEFSLSVNCPQVIAERKIYLCPGEEFTYKGMVISKDTTFADTVLTQNDLVCDSLYLFDVQRYQPDSVFAEVELCQGEIYYFGPDSLVLTASGLYLDTFPNIGGCDSIVLLDLTFRASYSQTVDVGICPSDSLVFKDSVYYEDVDLVDSLKTIDGCDSLVFMKVRFSDPVRTTTRFDICAGDSILIDGVYYSSSTSWTDTLIAKGGCDSISTVQIEVRDIFEQTLNVSLCSPESYPWQGINLTESGLYSDTLQTVHGCDSIIHLNLTVSPSYFSRDTMLICAGDSVFFNQTWLTGPGIYFSDYSTVNGCDSMAVLVIQEQEYAEKWESYEICVGDTIVLNNKSYAQPGIFQDTLISESSCDTLITIEIVLNRLEILDSTVVGAGSEDSTGSISVEIGGGVEPYSYQWSTGDTTAVLDSVPPGEYTLMVTDSTGCTTSFDLAVPLMTFVRQRVEEKNWISLRPNYLDRGRASEVVLEVHEEIRQVEISLYNELGIRLETRKSDLLQRGGSIQWKLGNLPAGMYYFHVREAGKIPFQVMRLVIF